MHSPADRIQSSLAKSKLGTFVHLGNSSGSSRPSGSLSKCRESPWSTPPVLPKKSRRSPRATPPGSPNKSRHIPWSSNSHNGNYSNIAHVSHPSSQISSCELPSHVWCWVLRHVDFREFGAVLCCSSTLCNETDAASLWHYHAFTSGYARVVMSACVDWIYPFMSEVITNHCIDWQNFLRLNSVARHLPSIWVRIFDMDLRVPLPRNSQHKCQLSRMLQEICILMSPFCNRWSSIPGFPKCSEDHFRLRLLQWAGRPGPVVQGPVTAGTHLLLEWMSQTGDAWPLPPHTQAPTSPRRPPVSLSRSMSVLAGAAGVSLRRFWSPTRRRSSSQWRSSLQDLDVSPQLHALVRVATSAQYGAPLPFQGELWLLLDLVSATMQHLYDLIVETLNRESSEKYKLAYPLKLQLRDRQMSTKVYPETTLLRSLFWTQCEALTLELDGELGDGSHMKIFREGGLVELGSGWCGSAGMSERIDRVEASGSGSGSSSSSGMEVTLAKANCTSQCLEPEAVPPAAEPRGDAHSQLADHDHAPGQRLSGSLQGGGGIVTVIASQGGATGECADDSRDGSPSDLHSEPATAIRERLIPHYEPKLLANSRGARQFEFHPSLPEVLLTGDKGGRVNVISAEEEGRRPPLTMDSWHVLGLSWLHHHPQSAVCGAHSGQIKFLRYDPQASMQEPALHHVLNVEEFPRCSSLSINCTDDFLLASGFAQDVAVYDTGTGQVLHRLTGAHQHYINISRFARRAPHIFATSSFDHACKVWDLRQPLLADRPLRTLDTGGLNVMCTFSNDDKYLLCSGIDDHITQYELPSFRRFPESFHLRASGQRERYRRSVYFATGRHFVTAATDESHIRVMSASGKSLGVVNFLDFRGQRHTNPQHQLLMDDMPRAACMPQGCFGSHLTRSFKCKMLRSQACEETRVIREVGSPVHGEVLIDTLSARARAASVDGSVARQVSIQSVRAHPIIENRMGVLLSAPHDEQESYVAYVHLDPNYIPKL